MSRIKYRIFYRFDVTLDSPLSIASGNSELTDHDVIFTADEEPVIPGSSAAGAIRNYISKTYGQYLSLFGYEKYEMSQSRMIISDMHVENYSLSVRDGIALDMENNRKTTLDTGKYDYQIIETGAETVLAIEFTVYNTDKIIDDKEGKPVTVEDVTGLMLHIVNGINTGEIRFGFKKNRGLGRIKISDDYQYKIFDFSSETERSKTAEDYIDFCHDIYCKDKYEKRSLKKEKVYVKNSVIRIPLKLEGGISIRKYSGIPDGPDYSQITIKNGNEGKAIAVIPGSTWNGAIRTRTFDILNEISLKHTVRESLNTELYEFWGVISNKDKIFQSSSVIFSESILEGSQPLKISRNRINRFDASTKDGALYSELSYFGGNTVLEIMIDNAEKYLWCIEILMMAVNDLTNGLLAVGGQTAVGRGIFSIAGDIEFLNMPDYEGAFANKIKGDEKQ